MSKKSPSFQFYATDWNASKAILLMKPIQHGFYINLMARAWDSDRPGTLPNDPEVLWRLARADSRKQFEKHSALVLKQFRKLAGGRLLGHPRLIAERKKQLAYSAQQAARGAEGGKAKALKDLASSGAMANAKPDPSRNLALQSSSSSSKDQSQNLTAASICGNVENLKAAAEKQISDAQEVLRTEPTNRGARLAFDEGMGQKRRLDALVAPLAAKKAL